MIPIGLWTSAPSGHGRLRKKLYFPALRAQALAEDVLRYIRPDVRGISRPETSLSAAFRFCKQVMTDLFSRNFQGISLPNFVERSILKLPLSKVCDVPLALPNRAFFKRGRRGRKRCQEEGRKRDANKAGTKEKTGPYSCCLCGCRATPWRLVDVRTGCLYQNACFFPGFWGPDRRFWSDVHRDIQPETSFWMRLFAYNWKLPAYSRAFLLTIDHFSFFTYS